MRITRLTLTIALLFAAIGCEKRDDEARKEDRQTKVSSPKPLSEEIVVELIEAGAEPRTRLRYNFQAGRQDKMVVDIKMSMAMSTGNMRQPELAIPTMRMTVQLDSKSVSDDGVLHSDFKIVSAEMLDDVKLDPQIAMNMRDGLEKCVGLTGSTVVNSRGFTLEADLDIPDEADPQVRQLGEQLLQQIRKLSTPWPEEPVGVGSKWKATKPIAFAGARLIQTANFELLELEGNKGKLGIQATQNAKEQRMDLPHLHPEATAVLKSLHSSASGTVRFDLAVPVPQSEMRAANKITIQINAQDQSQEIATDMKIDVKIHP